MWCPTKKLTNFIHENYIRKYKALNGVRFLKKSLQKDSIHQSILANLEGQLYDLRKREIIGILADQQPVREANSRLSKFLEYLVNNEKQYVFVYKSSGLDKKIEGVVEGNNPNVYLNKSQKSTSGWNLDFSLIKKRVTLLLGIAIFFSVIFLVLKSKQLNKSPLDQVTSWVNDDSDLWAIHLRSFATFENAVREKNSFTSRPISIVKLDDDRFYLFIFHDSKESAINEYSGKSIKKEWRNSRVIPIDLCDPKKDIRRGYYICD